jgi:hypothetical protein
MLVCAIFNDPASNCRSRTTGTKHSVHDTALPIYRLCCFLLLLARLLFLLLLL